MRWWAIALLFFHGCVAKPLESEKETFQKRWPEKFFMSMSCQGDQESAYDVDLWWNHASRTMEAHFVRSNEPSMHVAAYFGKHRKAWSAIWEDGKGCNKCSHTDGTFALPSVYGARIDTSDSSCSKVFSTSGTLCVQKDEKGGWSPSWIILGYASRCNVTEYRILDEMEMDYQRQRGHPPMDCMLDEMGVDCMSGWSRFPGWNPPKLSKEEMERLEVNVI